MTGRIMIVEDDRSMGEVLETDLRLRGLETVWYPTAEEALAQWQHDDVDVVLTDLKLPGLNGLDLCVRIVANRPDIPVVVLTAFGSMETAMAAMRAGAYDFVNKPVDMDALALVLERAVRHRALQAKVQTLSAALAQSQRFEELIGDSPPMQQLYQRAGPDCRLGGSSADHRGEWHRQGARGPGAARLQPACYGPVCPGQLPRVAADTAGERALWACAGRLY